MSFSDLVPYLSALIMLVTLAAAALGFRPALFKAASDIKDSVIASQKIEIEALSRRVKTCEEQASRTKRELYAVGYSLKQMGFFITLEDGFVSVFDVSQKVTRTTQIRPLHKLDKPPDDDNGDETQADAS